MSLLSFIVLLPLAGALLTFMVQKRLPTKIVLALPCALMACSMLLTWINVPILIHPQTTPLLPWGALTSDASMVFWSCSTDPLALAMLGLVTTVSTAVHIYAISYMHDDARRLSFLGLLSLFTFFMMLLVTASHMVQIFTAWEGVGLASYLLIGFWFYKPSASQAAMKAFIVNRIADVSLLVGLCLIYAKTDSFLLSSVWDVLATWSPSEKTLIAFCLIGGVAGKSAQFGFHVWLPDAMEGPTPVSALIHAATMVTAGVFFLLRFAPLFHATPDALSLLTLLGGITALWGGILACGQHDLKRTIAYSTCSHLGLMVLGCGQAAWGASLFHLLTHGMAKAMLFLSAGCVIHAFHGEQDMRNMGYGMRQLPQVYLLMILASLHLVGFPGLAGHDSKEALLNSMWHPSSSAPFVSQIGLILALGAVITTGFYTTRVILSVFHGQHGRGASVSSLHNPSAFMWGPIIALFLGSLMLPTLWRTWFDPTYPIETLSPSEIPSWLPLALGFLGAWGAWLIHTYKRLSLWKTFEKGAEQGLGVDALYHLLLVRPFQWIGRGLVHKVELPLHHQGVMGFAEKAKKWSYHLQRTQTGITHDYLLIMALGLAVLIGLLGVL